MTRYLPDCDTVMKQVLDGALPGVDHGTVIPSDLVDNLPFITFRTLGDKPAHPKLGARCRVVVQCWSDSRKTASDTAESVRIAVDEAPDTTYASGRVSFSECLTQPAEVPNTQPDLQPAQNLYRFQATYRLVVRPN